MEKTVNADKTVNITKSKLNSAKNANGSSFFNSVFSEEAVAKSCVGVWRIELMNSDENNSFSKLYTDKYLNDLLEFPDAENSTPEDRYDYFISEASEENTVIFKEAYRKLILGENIEVSISYAAKSGKNIELRITGRKTEEISGGIRFEGICRNITNLYSIKNSTYNSKFFNEVANVLSEIYDIIFYVDLKTNKYYEYNTNDLINKTSPMFSGQNFFKESELILQDTCHPEDMETMLRFTDKEYLIENLKNGKLTSPVYRVKSINNDNNFGHCRMKVVKAQSDTHHLIICFENAEEEVQNQERIDNNEKYYNNIIKMLSHNYLGLYHYNIETHEGKVVSMVNSIQKDAGIIIENSSDYIEAFETYICRFVHPEDRKLLENQFSKEMLCNNLKSNKFHSVIFRRNFNGEYKYLEMTIAKSEPPAETPKNLAVGFAEIDRVQREKIEKEAERKKYDGIIKALSCEYTSVYYVDTEKNTLLVYKRSERIKDMFGKNAFSSMTLDDAADLYSTYACSEQDRSLFRKSLSRNFMKEQLSLKPYYTMVYLNEKNQYCEMKAVRIEDEDEIRHVVLGFAVKDFEIRAELDRNKAIERDMAVIASLSDDFGCVVYVDLSSFEEIRYRLDPIFENDIPGWHKINNFSVRLNAMINNVVHPEDREYFFTATKKEKILDELNSQKSYSIDFRLMINKEVIYYRAKFVKDDSSKYHIIAGFKNIDKEKRKELAAIQKAEAANRAKTVFLSNMSHDIRTPMNAITGFIELAIRNIENPDKTLDYLKKAQLSNQHMIDIINNILDMSKIESGKVTLEETRHDIMLYGNDILPMLTNLADNKKINFKFSFGIIKNRNVVFDILKLNKAIINVISNAIKYTNEGGTVKLTIFEEETDFEDHGIYDFIIEDTGCGMSSSFITKAFDAFTREKASVGKEPGTGLGLAITKKLIELMGGTITVTSQLDIGSKFVIKLPMKFSENGITSYDNFEEIPDPDYFEGKRILVVEDNDLNREILTSILEDAGMKIDEALNGIEAVNMVQKKGTGYYDCILMDIQMPEMDGYTATREIRKLHTDKRIPIIALSANAFDEDRRKSFESDMDDHQAKPIIVPKLFACMKKFI